MAEGSLRAENRAAGRLYRISTALMAERELQDVVQRVTEESTALSGAQFGAFFYNVLDGRGESYMLYSIAGVPRSAFERFPMPRNTAVFDPTFQGVGRRPQRRHHRGPPLRPQRAAPRHAGGPPAGALLPRRAGQGARRRGARRAVLRPRATGVFDEDAERLVVAVAALAALAIENARLHDANRRELEASRRAYHERDHVARVLQESLLPPLLPDIEGLELAARYVPGAGMVGGDFYDVFALRDGAFGAALGDVQGKDARAAGMTSVVRHTLRATAQNHGPSAAMEIVNRIVLEEQEPSDPRFSSAVLARLERGGGGFRVVLASAGHPPALVVRADGRVEECHVAGTLLGITGEAEFTDAGAELAPGDALVLYTDGLIEARSADGILGEERVRELLARRGGRRRRTASPARWRRSRPSSASRRRDDLALLVARAI